MSEPKVRINGKILFCREKAPFLRSGKSIWGAMEYDETMDLLLPFPSDFALYLLPAQSTYALRFGSWQKALQAAGLSRHWKPKPYVPLPRSHDPATGHFTGVTINHDQTSS